MYISFKGMAIKSFLDPVNNMISSSKKISLHFFFNCVMELECLIWCTTDVVIFSFLQVLIMFIQSYLYTEAKNLKRNRIIHYFWILTMLL